MPPAASPPPLTDDLAVAVLGLGYVGLPLALAFGARYETKGYDIDPARVAALEHGTDGTGEVAAEHFARSKRATFTADLAALAGSDVFIVAVPTPIDARKRPDLTLLRDASRMVGKVLGRGGVVVFESTVFPGATEEVCVPLVEAASGLACNHDFFAGYSPERINPGDPRHGLQQVVKVTAGSTPATARFVDALYASIVHAGTHPAPDIRTAEAAKVIENVQRDVNIALTNEFAMIFHRMGLDTEAVLAAAGSKWNFLPFQPGLVGGHCIGVDPYYLTAKAEEVGHRADLVLAGRGINDAMPGYVAERVLALMADAGIEVANARILVLGFAFKENCADVRNSQVVALAAALAAPGAAVEVFDPCVEQAGDLPLVAQPMAGSYDAIVLAVAHDAFREMGAARIRAFGKPRHVLFDVKHLLPADAVDGRL